MLVITSTADLKRYLETRLNMARNQGKTQLTVGIIYGYEQSIEAVQALLEHEKEKNSDILKERSATDV
jgi:hypothetical protein